MGSGAGVCWDRLPVLDGVLRCNECRDSQGEGKMPQEKGRQIAIPCFAFGADGDFVSITRGYRRTNTHSVPRDTSRISGPRVGSQWLGMAAGRRLASRGGKGGFKSRGKGTRIGNQLAPKKQRTLLERHLDWFYEVVFLES